MRKLQNNLYITKDGAYLHKERETLLVEQRIEGKKEKLMQLPIHAINNILCFGNVMVSPQLMGFCGDTGTLLSFFDQFGRFQARVVGKQQGSVLLRRAQYRLADQAPENIARNIIVAKVQSSRAVLHRHLRNHGEQAEVSKAKDRLKRIVEQARVLQIVDVIRGLEGEAASHYFGVFNHLITNTRSGIKFNSRTRRPPKDPVNAMLSFLYAILGQEVGGALQGVGLDPQVGFLHKERPGRDSLAQDLLEEFRAYMVDRLVLSLINRQQVGPGDFVTDALGGVRMRVGARKQVLQAWQARKLEEITHPFLKEKVQVGLLPHVQSMLLARHIRGDLAHYPPFLVR